MKVFTLAINGKSQNVSVDRSIIAAYILKIARNSICESIPIQLMTSSQQRNVINCSNIHAEDVTNTWSETENQTPEHLVETDTIYNYDKFCRQPLRTRCRKVIQSLSVLILKYSRCLFYLQNLLYLFSCSIITPKLDIMLPPYNAR